MNDIGNTMMLRATSLLGLAVLAPALRDGVRVLRHPGPVAAEAARVSVERWGEIVRACAVRVVALPLDESEPEPEGVQTESI
mgnify:CR=1 FL=1